MGIVSPPPPPSDPAWNEVTAARAFPFRNRPGRIFFSKPVSPFSLNQEATEEVTREEPTVDYVSTVNNLRVVKRPIAAEYVGLLEQQPSLMAVDEKVRPKKL